MGGDGERKREIEGGMEEEKEGMEEMRTMNKSLRSLETG